MNSSTARWDIFCTVVDNFGDIGICWRVARQLAAEHGQQVRLWVDDLMSFHRICPEIDPRCDVQRARGVEVRHWSASFPALEHDDVADVVIEALACTLPQEYLSAMAARSRKPVWINLEHLSAEEWVTGCHGLASPHPQLPLTKHFFFPGFVAGTGGLLCERDLLAQRRAFQSDSTTQVAFWQSLGLPLADEHELRLSLFGYDTPEIATLAQAWADGPEPIRCLAPVGRLTQQLAAFLGHESAHPGDAFGRGNLTVHVLPFLEQDQYDRLLWGCDLNFVRGEDSFVRAQWAGRPLVWQAYRQEEGAHLLKLDAFLQRYCAGLPQDAVADVTSFWRAWNRSEGLAEHWTPFLARRGTLEKQGEQWVAQLTGLGDAVTNLVHFCQKYL
jgi:uncharacterized repeat protein (TIGR03837 family)